VRSDKIGLYGSLRAGRYPTPGAREAGIFKCRPMTILAGPVRLVCQNFGHQPRYGSTYGSALISTRSLGTSGAGSDDTTEETFGLRCVVREGDDWLRTRRGLPSASPRLLNFSSWGNCGSVYCFCFVFFCVFSAFVDSVVCSQGLACDLCFLFHENWSVGVHLLFRRTWVPRQTSTMLAHFLAGPSGRPSNYGRLVILSEGRP